MTIEDLLKRYKECFGEPAEIVICNPAIGHAEVRARLSELIIDQPREEINGEE